MCVPNPLNWGEAFLLTVGAFLITVKLLCLQSLNQGPLKGGVSSGGGGS